jgi:hypothetical protein
MAVLTQSYQPSPLLQLAHFVRRSRSLASMLPALLLSGVITLVSTAVMQVMGANEAMFGAWMESWLTAWPIAFPVTYLVAPSLFRLAAYLSAPAARTIIVRKRGLAFGDIAHASARVTVKNRFVVLRNLKPQRDFTPT